MLMMNLIYFIEQKALVNMLYIVNYSDTNHYFLFFYSSVLNPIPYGGGADSALLQIVFFITSVRDTAELRNLVTFFDQA